MNHAYRLAWPDLTQYCAPTPEFVRTRGKRSAAGSARAFSSEALPAGGRVLGGQAAISRAGSALTIRQESPRAVIDWESFNVSANASVIFRQPSADAVALIRVVNQDPSQILGSLLANGQVFIVNSAGIFFGPGARFDARGIQASTRDISVSDFLAGRDRFGGVSGGRVVNEGRLQAGPGGYVALIGAHVENAGEIQAPGGEVRLAADAADSLAQAVVNHTGRIETRGVGSHNGTIVILADMVMGEARVAGSLDAGEDGFVETSGQIVRIADGATVKAGRWLIDPTDFTIAATGGNISGATLSTNLDSTDVEIQSSNGGTPGHGDIHVNDAVNWSAHTLTLTAARDINLNAIMTARGNGKLVMKTATANGADQGVDGGTVRAGFAADGSFRGRVDFPGRSGTGFLTINGEDYTVINALGTEISTSPTDLQGVRRNLAGRYALGADIDASATHSWTLSKGFTPIGDDSRPFNQFTGIFDGLGHTIANPSIGGHLFLTGLFGYVEGGILRNVGLANAQVTRGSDIMSADASGGLAGLSVQGTIHNVYFRGSIFGGHHVGGVVGWSISTTISNSYVDAAIQGHYDYTGGLVGRMLDASTVRNAYVVGTVRGKNYVGGLVGLVELFGGYCKIGNAYAGCQKVIGTSNIGGLVGGNQGSITNTYSYSIVGTLDFSSSAGELVGWNDSSTGATVSNSFWNKETGKIGHSQGGTAITTAEMQHLATYRQSQWDIDASSDTGRTWRIYDGMTYPQLRCFLTPITITPAFDGSGGTYTNIAVYNTSIPGADKAKLDDSQAVLTVASSPVAGSVTVSLDRFSSQQKGYDICYAPRTIAGIGTGGGDLRIDVDLTWSAGTLALSADNDIHLASVLTVNGTGKLAMDCKRGTVRMEFASEGGFKGRVDFPNRWGRGFLAINGEDCTVINALGTQDSTTGTDLQGMQSQLSACYALGADIDAAETSGWERGCYDGPGFNPIARHGNPFDGIFEGFGHIISNLTINQRQGPTGLFSEISNGVNGGGKLRHVGLVNARVTGNCDVGGLVGRNKGGALDHVFTSGTICGSENVGGLVGNNLNSSSSIDTAYSTCAVTATEGNGNVGGLVGYNEGSVSVAYATGTVSGDRGAGGLVGYLFNGEIRNAYAIGTVAGNDRVGGLVGCSVGRIDKAYAAGCVSAPYAGGLVGGIDYFGGNTTDSFWDMETTSQPISYGGTGLATAQMKQLASFAGWDIDDADGTGKTWRIREGETYPLLCALPPPLQATGNNASQTDDSPAVKEDSYY